jgi:hypothetical protein
MPRRLQRRFSGRFPIGPLSLNQLGCRLTELNPGTPRNSLEDLLGYGASNLSFKNSLNIFGQSLTPGSGTSGQLPMEPIRYVPHLDHL